MKKKFQVFVSSTYSDLINERQAAVEAILKAGHIPAGMELFSAGSESQLDIIKRWIDDSDIYMLLLGGRYGSIEPKSQLSYTEVEYRYALESGKPVFALIMTDSAFDEKVKSNGKAVIETDNSSKLGDFRKIVMSKICTFFKDMNEIKLGVIESLLTIERRDEIQGWVRGIEMPDITGLLKEIKELREVNERLTKEQATVMVTSNDSSVEKIGNFSYSQLKKIFETEVIIGNNSTTNLLDVFINTFSTFILGLSVRYGSDAISPTILDQMLPTLVAYGMLYNNGASIMATNDANKFIAMYKMELYQDQL